MTASLSVSRARRLLAAAFVILTASGALAAPQTAASPGEVSGLRQDMQAMRRSVDELVTILRQFIADSGRRERASLLVRRIEVAERQLAALTTEWRAAQAELSASDRAVAQAQGRAQSAAGMATLDRGGTAAPLLQQEHQSAMRDEADAQTAAAATRQRLAELEADIAGKRTQIRNLEAALEREAPSIPK